jgi:hypothetical protein
LVVGSHLAGIQYSSVAGSSGQFSSGQFPVSQSSVFQSTQAGGILTSTKGRSSGGSLAARNLAIYWIVRNYKLLKNKIMDTNRAELLHKIAKTYVVDGLGAKNFDAIPYHENVSLRAPLNPGGSETPITGREVLRNTWWAPLPTLVKGTTFIDSYINTAASKVTVEFFCDIIEPACRLRIVDRLIVDENGKIIDQENFFDPRGVTNPT